VLSTVPLFTRLSNSAPFTRYDNFHTTFGHIPKKGSIVGQDGGKLQASIQV
jgi:hypothetical protein